MSKLSPWWGFGAAFMAVTAVVQRQWWWLAGAGAMALCGLASYLVAKRRRQS